MVASCLQTRGHWLCVPEPFTRSVDVFAKSYNHCLQLPIVCTEELGAQLPVSLGPLYRREIIPSQVSPDTSIP